MAEKKFSELTAKGATIADTDIVAISESAGGGTYTSKSVTGANIKALVTDANMTTTDITTNDVSTSKHGFAPKAPNDATKFLDGTGAYDTVKDSDLSLSDITTNNVSTTQHGFVPKAPNDTTKFLRGDGTWEVPVSGSTSGKFGIADSTGTYTYYTTLTLAMAAATSGQTIEFFTDYTETGNVTIQLKNGVHINGNGHTYTHSYAAGNSNTFVNTSGVISCVISNLRVIRTGRANGTTGDLVIYTTQYSEILFENVYVESTYGNAVTFESGATSTYKAMQGSLYAKAYLGAIVSFQHIEGLKGESTTNGIGVSVNGSFGGSPKATNCIGISVSGKGMMVSSNASGYNCVAQSISGQGMTNGPYYNCTAISVSGPAGETIQGAYNCSFISSSGFGCDGIYGSNNTLISASGAGVYAFFGFSLYNSYVYSSGNVGASTRGSILSNCVVITDWNNAGGHSVSEWFNSSIGKTLNCHLKVANASANCIASPSGALNMKYASNVFEGATTPVNANITQTITNTEDNQGNILI